MLFKSFESKVEDLDQKGIVTIYVNAFGNLDSDGDITQKGAFTKTIQEGTKRIRHLYNHDLKQLLGLPLEMIQDDYGLLVRSKMNLAKQLVKDVFSDYEFFAKEGKTLEHSIGFEAMKRKDSDKRVITEYKLYEYSTLSFLGANENTPLVDLKSREDVGSQIEFMEGQLLKGSYSDEKFKQIEKQLNRLQKAFTRLKPSNDTEISETEAIEIIKRNLNL